ncbi:sulfatase-like hydrolase/transferase [Campylobacter sp. MIT 19-121]|uniref:phosphoethanolamine transferase n=1 Tax=Campylobacter sp. MIT 19-121 TaxID=2703906 RepID=UPI00138974AE|nr:phosphoethanolamine transferase [Campylobacter sp. MIT 19-121]NDJ26506.1 sulfatase-like hydrolase/transferase [Campylobacter sp. MIT 19-121]
MFYYDSRFAKSFILLFVLNSFFITLAQIYNLPKLFDAYWFYSFFYRESMLFCTYFLAFCLIYFIKIQWFQKLFLACVIILSVLFFLINLFMLYHFEVTLNDYLVSVALQSDPRESKEFFITYFDLKFCLLAFLFCVLFYLVYKYARALKQGGGSRVILLVFVLLLLFVTAAHIFKFRPHYERASDVIYNTAVAVNGSLKKILSSMKEYEKISHDYDEFIKDLNYTQASKEDQIQNLVLIIGESAQRNLMQIYGYKLKNTPNLSKLKDEKPKNLLVFDDVISSRATTYESLSQVLSFANQENNNKEWFEYLNLIDAMRLGGYKNINISNQEKFSLFDKASTTIFGRSDEVHWASLSSYFENSKPDEKILPLIDKVLAKQYKPLFLSVHIMGNHAIYYNRYPKEFAIFSEKDIQSKFGKKTRAEYANAVLYTDFVLSEVIKKFQDTDSLIIYISDHGEDVYDSGEEYQLHNDVKINRFMVEVPFIIYASDTFQAKHPKAYEKIVKAQNRPFMLDDLVHAIIDIAGFNIDGFEAKRSLFADDPSFLENRARRVGKSAQKDYDKELKNQLFNTK